MRHWNQLEELALINMMNSGYTYKEISLKINRNPNSIRIKALKLGCNYRNVQNIEKICLQCGKSFEISQHCKKDMNKKFCSQTCSAIHINKNRYKDKVKEISKRKCINCGKELIERHKIKFCNAKCQQEYKVMKIFENIEQGDTSYSEYSYRKYLIHKYGAICMECGWSKINPYTGKVPIQMDHIDGNAENNDLSNLKLLCPSCHSLTPTYGALNSGHGKREKRNQSRRKKNLLIVNQQYN
jgi:endogenous inhibitor of DNA gyrase (YacG/DUF329 family)